MRLWADIVVAVFTYRHRVIPPHKQQVSICTSHQNAREAAEYQREGD